MTELPSESRLAILVVEDEPVVRNLMVTVLAGKNHHVLEADSAAEALEVSNTFDGAINVLIADHSLKTMTGRQVAERMQQSRPDLKVIHISGDLMEKLEQEGGLMPGAEFLAKPFSPTDLVEKVNQVLGRGRSEKRHPGSREGRDPISFD